MLFQMSFTNNSSVGDEVDGGVDLVRPQAGVVHHRHLGEIKKILSTVISYIRSMA